MQNSSTTNGGFRRSTISTHPPMLPQLPTQLINWLGCELWLILKWPNALLARMIWNSNLYFAHIVVVVQLGQLMAESVRICRRARFARCSDKRRINCDANNVVAWRNR